MRPFSLFVLAASLVAAAGPDSIHPYPLWPSTPVPGWPGVDVDKTQSHSQYGQPEFLPYPGSVEHVRREMQRYVPPYPVYNHATLRRNFVLHKLPAYADRCVAWAEPVYYNPMYGARAPAPQKRPPVRALPWKPGGKPIRLALGKLPPSLYALRIIAAAPDQKTVAPRKYAFLRLRVNDDRADAARTNAYILRAQLLDNFYAIQEFYIQSLGDHELTAELSLLPESEQSLLVYNIDLHDRFGQCARRRGKRGTSLVDVEARHRLWAEAQETQAHKAAPPAGDQEQRDDAAWNGWLPPLNTHTGQNLGTGRYDRAHWDTDRWCMAPEEWKGKTLLGKPLVREFGTDPLYRDSRGGLHAEPPRYAVDSGTCWWRNEKLGPFAEITVKDGAVHHKGRRVGEVAHANTRDGMLLEDGRPVRKVGRFYALQGHKTFDPQGQRHLVGEVRMRPGLTYDSEAVTNAYRLAWRDGAAKGIGRLSHWQQRGDRQAARDQAMRLVRFAWDWPAVRPSRQLNFIMGGQGLDRRYVRRYQWYPPHDSLLDIYDSLFEFIDGNEAFARAVGRYLPYIKTPDDVVRFLDTRLVQDYANDMMHYRYYYDHGQAKLMVKAVLVQGDRAITDPWMAFLWTRGWEYPQALSGAADNIVTSIGRDGGTNVGSIFYGIGGQLGTVQLLETYIGAGGDAKYDLTDPARYPKSRETIFLPFESAAAGRHVLGVGDVGGPSCAYGRIVHLANLRGIFATGWRWTRDPRFAYELVHTFGRKGEPGDEWGPIVAAAATTRDPYLMNRSRILADWSAFLTGGPDEDDFRFRRSVAVRVGNGHGHAHADTLDLRLWAHGVTMSGDLGMRPAYGRPGHQRSRVHNVVEVDGRDWNSHAWAPHLFDAPGAAYLVAESTAPYGMEHVTLFRRQTALVDADPGVRSPKKPPQTDPDVATPSSYVFDVFRVAGGSTHTYCFHGCVDDGFEVNVANRRAMTGQEGDPDEAYLSGFRWRTFTKDPKPADAAWAADPAADTLVATWRLSRGPDRGWPEARMYSGLYGKHGGAMTAPRKFTRLHLFGQTGNRVLHGICIDKTLVKEHNPPFPGYAGRCLFARRRGAKLETAFVALVEPYAGEPFIRSRSLVAVDANETDALRAVAVAVEVRNGRRDLCFADGRPDRARTVGAAGGPVRVAGEFAYLSLDAAGLRQATLTGGTLLDAPAARIEIEGRGHHGKVVAVDYPRRRVTVDARIPAALFAGRNVEVGSPEHRTSFHVTKIERVGKTSVLTLRKGIEIMQSHVTASEPASGRVTTGIAMLRFRGRDRGLTASNESLAKFWRVAYTGGDRHRGHTFQLSGAPVAQDDFPPGSVLRVWEFGVDDTVAVRTGVSVRRVADGVFQVTATTGFRLSVRGKALAISPDRKAWTTLPVEPDGERVRVAITEAMLGTGRVYVRIGK